MPRKVPKNPTDEQLQDLATLSGYQHSPRCQFCNAKDPVTRTPVRGDIEDVYMRMGLQNAMMFAKTMGIIATERTFQRHVTAHSPYIRAGIWVTRTRGFIKKAMEEHAEADSAIQTIINVGNKMIEEGEMLISEKLYLEALKMKSKEKRVIPLEGFINVVEGEIFDGSPEPEPVEPVKALPEAPQKPVAPKVEPKIKARIKPSENEPLERVKLPELIS